MVPWKVLASRYVLRRKWMDVREDRVQLPSGVVLDEFHVIEYPDWVCVIPITDGGEVVLVEQYRHAIARTSTEFPAGVIDGGEDVVTAAQRELLEETGFGAREWIHLGSCAPEPSRHANAAHFVVARGAYRKSAPTPDDSETIRVRVVPLEGLSSLVRDGHMVHGVHIAALHVAAMRGQITV